MITTISSLLFKIIFDQFQVLSIQNIPQILEEMGQNTKKFSAQVRVPLEAEGYQISKGLGKGAFGDVFLATKKGVSYAIKAIDKQQVKKRPFLEKYIKQEIEIMNALNHPNIVKQETVIETKNFYFMVLQYCNLGNLMSYQAKLPNKRYPLKEASDILMDVIKGLKVIHQNGYVHRDIKSQNVLIKTTEKGGKIFKIADFGFARPIQTVISTYCGTQKYMAPEILDNKSYTRSVDLWALGVLFYFMLFAEYPFGGMNIKDDITKKCTQGFEVKKIITKVEKLTEITPAVEDFFRKIFQIDSKKRLTFAKLLSHPLFAGSHCRQSRRFYEQNESNQKLIKEYLQQKKTQKKDQETAESDPAADLIVEEVQITNQNKAYSKQISSTSFEISKIIYLRECSNELYSQSSFAIVDRLCFRYYVLRAFLFYSKRLLKDIEEGKMPSEFKEYKLQKWAQFASSQQIKTLVERLKEQLLKGELDFSDTYSRLKQIQGSIKIKSFTDKFSEFIDDKDFQSFKIPYRSTVSYFFKLLHDNKSIDSHTKNKLKLKLFCCHMINRIFNQNQISNNFEYFVKWLDTYHKGQNTLNFTKFRQWVLCETKENLEKNISHLHQIFFNK